MQCWEWTSSLCDSADLRPPLCSASANINLRKAQAVVNILLKATRDKIDTFQEVELINLYLFDCMMLDYTVFFIKFSIWKVRWFLIYIYMLSLTRGRSNCFWIKLASHKKVSPTTRTVKHGRAVVQRRIICHMLNLILRSHLIIQSRMLIRSTMINKC